MPSSDGVIDSRNMCSQAVVERVLGDASVSSVKIANDIQSDNYSAGSAGWKIFRNTGSVEFQDATIRGTLNASDITSGTLSAARIAANSLNIGKISGGTYGNSDITFSSGSDLVSSNYSVGSAGWKINGAGDAEFNNVTIRGTLNVSTIEGTITMAAGGVLRTATSGARIELSDADFGSITAYTGLAQETQAPSYSQQIEDDGSSVRQVMAAIESGQAGAGTSTSTLKVKSKNVLGSEGASIVADCDIFAVGIDVVSGWFTVDANDALLDVDVTITGALDLTGNLTGANGSASAPSVSFGSDTGTGMYRAGTNQIGFTAGGSQQAIFHTGGMRGRALTGSFWMNSAAGTAALPTYAFYGDTDTGMYRITTDTIGWAVGGSEAVRITADPHMIIGGLTTGYPYLLSIAGNANAPTYTFYGDSNTGAYRYGADEYGISAGGAVMARFLNTTTNEIRMQPVYDSTGSGDATVGVTSTGLLRRQTSALKYKRNEQHADWLADIQLQPIEYDTKPNTSDEPDDAHRYGLVADWIATQLPDAGVYNGEGGIEDYQNRAVLAILAAKINRLENHSGT